MSWLRQALARRIQSMASTWTCDNCGTTNPHNCDYCTNCGADH